MHTRTEKLTKQNFWNDLQTKYPNAMKEFCGWIDKYKVDVEWKSLFQTYVDENVFVVYKYHHIPLAMQVGIFLQFVSEQSRYASFPVCGDWKEVIFVWFKNREHNLKDNRQ